MDIEKRKSCTNIKIQKGTSLQIEAELIFFFYVKSILELALPFK